MENQFPLNFKNFLKKILARFQELFLEIISFKIALLILVLVYLSKIPAESFQGLAYLKDFIAVFGGLGVGAYKFFDKKQARALNPKRSNHDQRREP